MFFLQDHLKLHTGFISPVIFDLADYFIIYSFVLIMQISSNMTNNSKTKHTVVCSGNIFPEKNCVAICSKEIRIALNSQCYSVIPLGYIFILVQCILFPQNHLKLQTGHVQFYAVLFDLANYFIVQAFVLITQISSNMKSNSKTKRTVVYFPGNVSFEDNSAAIYAKEIRIILNSRCYSVNQGDMLSYKYNAYFSLRSFKTAQGIYRSYDI